jgi:tetratricopeptide (TPR) repeat protein
MMCTGFRANKISRTQNLTLGMQMTCPLDGNADFCSSAASNRSLAALYTLFATYLVDASNFNSMKWRYLIFLVGGGALIGFGAGFLNTKVQTRQAPATDSSENRRISSALRMTSCAIALAPHKGDEAIDREIRNLQDEARSNPQRSSTITLLGWAYITKARLSYDPGYYKLGEQCALFLRSKNEDDPDALLLQGHILQSLHRFKDAEPIARKLLTIRNERFDCALLGDVLMEQGRLNEAIEAYQKMIDLRPDLQSYTRVAHMRWLKGDLDGAIAVMRMAVTSGSPRDSEPTAWAYTRLGIYQLQAGDTEMAIKSGEMASQFAENYAAALLLRGRILLAQNHPREAIEFLQRAADLTQLPEYQWTLADALREVGKWQEAEEIERILIRNGGMNDPRTLALYLATRRQEVQQALKLAEEEMNTRADIFTMDTLAWAYKANGRLVEAREFSKKALSERTQDARLFYHAGCIAMAVGDSVEAGRWFALSERIKQMLMPSERDDLEKNFAVLRKRGESGSKTVSN